MHAVGISSEMFSKETTLGSFFKAGCQLWIWKTRQQKSIYELRDFSGLQFTVTLWRTKNLFGFQGWQPSEMFHIDLLAFRKPVFINIARSAIHTSACWWHCRRGFNSYKNENHLCVNNTPYISCRTHINVYLFLGQTSTWNLWQYWLLAKNKKGDLAYVADSTMLTQFSG